MYRHISIIMYHYVRELKHSRYHRIKGMSLEKFREQLKYIKRFYIPVTMEELIASIKDNKTLPPNAILLTFDDGLLDHFLYVLPLLDEFGIQGSFFIPGKAIIERKLFDVNKIQFILAMADDVSLVKRDLLSMMHALRKEYLLQEDEYYLKKWNIPDPLDSGEIIFVKRMLQKELSRQARHEITEKLFQKYVNVDEKILASELYMNLDQLKYMKHKGMHIGGHGFDHDWMDILDDHEQREDINLMLNVLEEIGCDTNNWTMAYPFGAYNSSLLSLIKAKKAAVGFTSTSESDIADIDSHYNLILPRLDAIHIPADGNAKMNDWTTKARASMFV